MVRAACSRPSSVHMGSATRQTGVPIYSKYCATMGLPHLWPLLPGPCRELQRGLCSGGQQGAWAVG